MNTNPMHKYMVQSIYSGGNDNAAYDLASGSQSSCVFQIRLVEGKKIVLTLVLAF